MMPTNILLYTEFGAWPCSDHQGFIQELVVTDVETQSQILGQAQGIPQKKERKIVIARGVKYVIRKPTESKKKWAQSNSQKLNQQ